VNSESYEELVMYCSARSSTSTDFERRSRDEIISIVILAAVLTGVAVLVWTLTKTESQLVLTERSMQLSDEYSRFVTDQGISLAAMGPPSETDALSGEQWAQGVTRYFGSEVAPYVVHDGRVTWIGRMPTELAMFVSQADTHFVPSYRDEPPVCRIGSTEIWMTTLTVAGQGYNIWAVARQTNCPTWGIVYKGNRDWLRFFKACAYSPQSPMSRDTTTPAIRDNAFCTLFALGRSTNPRSQTQIRAYLADSLIFASPGFAATSDSFQPAQYSSNHRVVLFPARSDFRGSRERPFIVAAWVFAMLVLTIYGLKLRHWYTWVKRLTRGGLPGASKNE
jgi:hypothetical protein